MIDIDEAAVTNCRGGPQGFFKVLDEQTLALADFVGNAQYVSIG